MPYSIVFLEKSSHLLCVSDGTVTGLEEYVAWGIEIISRVKESKQRVLLLDNRTLHLDVTTYDVIVFAEMVGSLGVPLMGLKIGVISASDNKEVSKMVETALVNRSAVYRSFDCQKDAHDWLSLPSG